MTNTQPNTATVTESHVAINGKAVAHRDMMLACCQADAELAADYRSIVLASVLPIIAANTNEAYDAYVHAPMAVEGRLVNGHGSFVAGPNPAAQERWQTWQSLRDAYRAASHGIAPASIPASRAHSGVREWEKC